MKKYKVCVYAICKNEEKFIEKWVKSMSEAESLYIPWIIFLVVCGLDDIIDIFVPMILFIKVDLPTFGLPINPTNPDFILNHSPQMGKDINL